MLLILFFMMAWRWSGWWQWCSHNGLVQARDQYACNTNLMCLYISPMVLNEQCQWFFCKSLGAVSIRYTSSQKPDDWCSTFKLPDSQILARINVNSSITFVLVHFTADSVRVHLFGLEEPVCFLCSWSWPLLQMPLFDRSWTQSHGGRNSLNICQQ